jgi:CheY-like chemotaxis protein
MGRTVLCVSKTSPAQMTRDLILERAGYRVVSTNDPGEATRIFTATPVHAVVLGDSLPAEQRMELAKTLKNADETVPIIAFNNSSGTQISAGIVDEQLESLGDPQLLLEALKRVLPVDGNQRVDGNHSMNGNQSVDGNQRVDGNHSMNGNQSVDGNQH